MAIRWAPSARRHGIAHYRSEHVIQTATTTFRPPGPRERPVKRDCILYLGFDAGGLPLEVIAVELANGDLLVIHAMKMHAEYHRYVEKDADAKASDRRTRRRRARTSHRRAQ